VEGPQIDHNRPHVLCSLLRSRWNRGSNLTRASSPLPVCTIDGKLSPSCSRISSVCSRVDIKLAYCTAGEARSTTGQPSMREVLSAAARDAHSCFKTCAAVCISWRLACRASPLVAHRRKTCTRQLGSPVSVFLGMAADRAVSWMRDPCGSLDGCCFAGRYTFGVVEMTIGRAIMVLNSICSQIICVPCPL
jgi:hypothetical protein